MPMLKKAELVKGVVYVPSPANHPRQSAPHGHILTWLGVYTAATTGIDFGNNATVRLDFENEIQPDALLRYVHGGRSRLGPGGFLDGTPELAIEVSASSASYDLHDKFRAYQRNDVLEYLVWRVDEAAIDWFAITGSRYERIAPVTGVLRSRAFPRL
jgi:Uma2 family endonuclease